MPELPSAWKRTAVAFNRDKANPFLCRPGQILADSRDAAEVAKLLPDYKPTESKAGTTLFTGKPQHPDDPAREILDQLTKIRRATGQRPQGPARVAPNHVLVGEAITMTGEPRIQGGPGSSVRTARRPAKLPIRNARPSDGKGVKIAVLDTGLFKHEWLRTVVPAPNCDDAWDADGNGYADNEAGHGTFIAGLILQIAPAAEVHVVKVLDSHGVGDDATVAHALEQLPSDVDIINLSLGGYTDKDSAPLAIANVLRKRRTVTVAAAGNNNQPRPFWPAAFKQAVGVGAVDQSKTGHWTRAPFSNYGHWVDAAARGVNLQSTFTRAKTLVSPDTTPDPTSDPTVAFDGWAAWDGTSFATPIVAAMLARTMSRNTLSTAAEARDRLLAAASPAPAPDFPISVLIDELG